MRHLTSLLVIAALTASAGCGSGLRVTGLRLGRGIAADASATGATATFKPNDTVYLSVQTAGVGSGTIGVRWTYGGRVIDEPKKQVSYRDVAYTEFHLQSVRGFPPGEYTVEVFLDGQSAGSRTFHVEA
jgi:hypothetical protein